MADHTHIEWTDATWNPIAGCSVVSPGCTNCYAMKLAGTRLKHLPSRQGLTIDSKAGPVWNGQVRFNEQWLTQPLRWKRPRRIFVCAHGDLFAENVPDEWIDRVFAVMALAPQHTFQVLTKRAARMREYLVASRASCIALEALELTLLAHVANPQSSVGSECMITGDIPHLKAWPLPNVWVGVSAEDQQRAVERVPELLATPAAIRFVSAEPLLGPIDFDVAWHGENALASDCWGDCAWCDNGFPPLHNCQRGRQGHACEQGRSGLDWIIVGGESGKDARPMHPAWARSIRDQCAIAGVPFFFKQWGSFRPLTEAEHGQACGATLIGNDPYDVEAYVLHVGKQRAGRLLDGVEHNAMPELPA